MAADTPQPQLRASDADREAAADRLQAAAVEGRLDSEELEQRLGEVYAARYCTDLTRITADVTPPAPPPAPAPMPVYAPPAQNATTNGLAVASLVAGLVWFAWLGSICAVIFGHIALGQIKESGGRETGRGLAIGGLALGYIGIAWLLIFLAAAAGS
jgi:hypothetical protein